MEALLALEPNPVKDALIYARFSGSEFKKVHWYRKNKLYFKIECSYQNRDDPNYHTFFQSHCSESMEFQQFQISFNKLKATTDDPQIPIRIRFFDSTGNEKKDKMIGECYTNIATLQNSIGKAFQISRTKKNGENENSGSFIVNSFRIQELTPFIEFAKHGLKFNIAVAIDMFYVNDRHDLHKPGEPNNYEQVLASSLEVLMPYSAGDAIASYALGYSYKTKFTLCGNLSLKQPDLYLHGIQEVMDAYRYAVDHVSFAGSSWFTPMIQQTTQLAEINFKNFKAYTIVLVLTTGLLEDKLDTIKAFNKASHSPVSYVFINLGPENLMEIIDADDKPLVDADSVQARDCVDYIFYKNVIDQKLSLDHEIMKEIPTHVSTWANIKGIPPNYFSS